MKLNQVYLLHIILIAPFLAYIGWYGRTANDNAFIICKILAVITILYHTYLLLKNNVSNLPGVSNYNKSDTSDIEDTDHI